LGGTLGFFFLFRVALGEGDLIPAREGDRGRGKGKGATQSGNGLRNERYLGESGYIPRMGVSFLGYPPHGLWAVEDAQREKFQCSDPFFVCLDAVCAAVV
jgi:hypothetical protein